MVAGEVAAAQPAPVLMAVTEAAKVAVEAVDKPAVVAVLFVLVRVLAALEVVASQHSPHLVRSQCWRYRQKKRRLLRSRHRKRAHN